MTQHRADRDQQGQGHRQVDAHAHAQRRQPHLAGPAQRLVDDDRNDAQHTAKADQTPIKTVAQHASCQR